LGQSAKKILKIAPFNIVIFGGDGDLAIRKIYPALFHRYVDDQIKCDFNIYAVTRSTKKHTNFYSDLESIIEKSIDYDIDRTKIADFIEHIKIINIPKHTEINYKILRDELNKTLSFQNIYYYSTPANAFGEISNMLKKCNLINLKSKVVLEKPLGFSLSSSKEIHSKLMKCFGENQIYRIDHYLGKETVQNLMVLRFANHLFEHSWSSEDIESVQITVAETIGVESRGNYYEKSGALLDMVQNHLLQLLCLIAMEPPSKLDANSVRNEKLKVLESLRFLNEESILKETVKGQYIGGKFDENEMSESYVSSYLQDINKYESETETFVAIKAFIDNWRWKKTPFYLRTGKRMKKRYSEIIINFKSVRHNLFPSQSETRGNALIIRLQPEESIELVQMTKLPGPGGYRYKPISLKLDYLDSFHERLPEAYERLIIDVLRGEQTLFMRQDELEAAWAWIESIKNSWEKTNFKNILYEAGSWGPGDEILDKNHTWRIKF
jgi:glucose-6-phosphate 1-dehydrogenase